MKAHEGNRWLAILVEEWLRWWGGQMARMVRWEGRMGRMRGGCCARGALLIFANKSMEGGDESSESAIINIAINIFQNVGIRRWIEEIEILKNEQIYFQICKIIFPETIIHLFRLSENHALFPGQKIQGVIDLIAKIIKNDLYHISGEAIANGKITHLKNFLQLLEALSNSMITKDRIEVESAPENDQSLTYNEHNKSYYTVIGIDKEFGDMTCFEEGEMPNREAVRDAGQLESDGTTSTEHPDPLPPNYHPKKGKVDSQRNTPPLSSHHSRARAGYPQPLKSRNQRQFEEENQKWLSMVRGIDETKLNLQREQMQGTKESFLRWKGEQNYRNGRAGKNIERESKARKDVINHQINQREHLVSSLKGEDEARRVIRSLFAQEKKVRARNQNRLRAREEENLRKMTDFKQLDQLLRLAVSSTRSAGLYRQQ